MKYKYYLRDTTSPRKLEKKVYSVLKQVLTQIYVSFNRLEETDPHRKFFLVFFLNDIGDIIWVLNLKGVWHDTRFSTAGFYHDSVSSGPLSIYPLGAISNCYKNSQRYSQTDHKLFTGVNDSSDKLSPVSLLPCDKLLLVSFTQVIKPCPVFYRFHDTGCDQSLVTTLYSRWRSIASKKAQRELGRGQSLFNSKKVCAQL